MIKITKDTKIGIIGLGMVGTQIERWFRPKKRPVFVYDKFKKIGSLENLNSACIIFLCLPTPHIRGSKLGVNFSEFEKVIKFFKKQKIFVIKSTVPPGTTDYLQKRFKYHYFFHNPEFLTESRAWREFSKPNLQLIGYAKKSKKLAENILDILPKAKYSDVMPAVATEIFKFARNAFFSVKVIFANQVYDLCRSFKINYEDIKKAMAAEPWMGTGQHLEVIHKGYRGFGGKCLPKDLKTLIKVFKSQKLKPELFETADKINEEILEKQKLTERLKKQWLNNKN